MTPWVLAATAPAGGLVPSGALGCGGEMAALATGAWPLASTALVLVAAYLVGSIPFSYLIVKLVKGRDVRTLGSGNPGASNVLRTTGKVAGAAALLLDCGKGVAAVTLARGLGQPPPVVAAVAVAVVSGHIFPVFLGFRGGKGVASAAGALGALAPAAFAGALVVFVLVVAWRRYISLGSIAAACSLPLLIVAGERAGWMPAAGGATVAAACVIAVLVVARHAGNLVRLRRGTEARLGEPLPAEPPPARDAGR
jgi:glycerol-3-phosphate acyltransferase PlsY